MGKVGFGMTAGIAAVTCTVAAAVVGRRIRSRRDWRRAVEVVRELEAACGTSVNRLRQVVDAMAVEMHAGLASEGGSKLKMLLTFVDKLPNGSEKGIFYALDIGGTNFRVIRVHLGGRRSGILRHNVERNSIPQHLMTSTSEELFDFIAMSLKQFVDREEEKTSEPSLVSRRELGVTFPFPVKQRCVSSGILMKWTKGFSVADMIGKDVSESLQQSMIKKDLGSMRVAALVNDTVGTLAVGHYNDEDTVAAVIIGTGTNACYLERADAIIKSQGLLMASGGMVVNMEWGDFWSSHLPRTRYDIDLDAESPSPNDQVFEKMISGMYLGDIVRRVVLRISQESGIFGSASSRLSTPFILGTPLMATMHQDDTPDLREVAAILNDVLGIADVSLKARKLIVNICDIITHRAARLVAAGIVGILKKIGRDGSSGVAGGRAKGGGGASSSGGGKSRTVVAIEGSLYTNYTLFREYLNDAVAEILGKEFSPFVILKVTEDGSGIGAALLAASHSPNSADM
ncbi:hypothetical protein Nepgr_014861 [Nepenthes gracilis]|uniref:Phosphotransferase n=1 Tax=Nepenthes gracilis TaxID=150966 RepID=A0AAD3XQW5_NEPGR|nr:hypothetical protein Nepgr_014861 [Nepenthes gracilis]